MYTFKQLLNKTLLQKFNPYHDRLGRFTTSGSATSFTFKPGAGAAYDRAIEREKKQHEKVMPSAAQEKTLNSIATKTRNLKKEQLRVVDREGNVIMQKQGDKHSVEFTVGEARDNFAGNVTIHNHPEGGTFSTADIRSLGYGPTEIRAAAPEGTYILRNLRYGTKYDALKEKTWFDMQNDLESASDSFKSTRKLKMEIKADKYKAIYDEKVGKVANEWLKRKNEGASQEELDGLMQRYRKADAEYTLTYKPKIEADVRKAYTDQYDTWYKQNAQNYGMEYQFIPAKSKTKKSMYEEIEKTADSGDIALDADMNKDVEDLIRTIWNDIVQGPKIP